MNHPLTVLFKGKIAGSDISPFTTDFEVIYIILLPKRTVINAGCPNINAQL